MRSQGTARRLGFGRPAGWRGLVVVLALVVLAACSPRRQSALRSPTSSAPPAAASVPATTATVPAGSQAAAPSSTVGPPPSSAPPSRPPLPRPPLPRPPSSSVRPASRVLAALPIPAVIRPLITPPVPGEGIWQPTGARLAGGYGLYTTHLRPAAGIPPAGIAWINMSATRLVLYAGTSEPYGVWPRQGAVPAARLRPCWPPSTAASRCMPTAPVGTTRDAVPSLSRQGQPRW